MSACGTGPDDRPLASIVDPLTTVGQLPVPEGFTETAGPATADATALERVLFADSDVALAADLKRRGLLRAATRHFAANAGGALDVAVAVWGDHATALASGNLTAERAIDRSGANAWNPSELRGAQGSEPPNGGSGTRTLARAIAQNALFVRTSGAVPAAAAIRAMQRLTRLTENPQPGR